jgi:hypothetical protein
LGVQVKLAGIVVTGSETAAVLWLPGVMPDELRKDWPQLCNPPHTWCAKIIDPTPDEWIAILQQTDNPEIFELDETGAVKAIHRKSMRAIGAAIQWGIWRRDGFRCMYCGCEGGVNRPLTVDHFVPVELGGTDEIGNLLSTCRACNKKKSSRPPEEFCRAAGLDYEGLVEYLAGRAPKMFIEHLQDVF